MRLVNQMPDVEGSTTTLASADRTRGSSRDGLPPSSSMAHSVSTFLASPPVIARDALWSALGCRQPSDLDRGTRAATESRARAMFRSLVGRPAY
jgi:hypothetical protein